MIIGVLFVCTAPGRAQVSATLSNNKIRIGEQVYLTLAVPAEMAGKSIVWPVLKDTINAKIEILDSVIDASGLNKKYLITSFDSGYYALKPFVFSIDGSPAETNALLLEVHTVPVDTTQAIKDIKEIRSETYTAGNNEVGNWLLKHWYVPAGILLLVLALVVYLLRRNRKEPEVPKVPEIVLPLHEQLLIDLEQLEARQLWQNNQVKQYYVELTDLLRTYVEKRFKVKALEQTTVQLIQNLKTSSINPEALQILKNILEQSDMVKFAKAQPTGYENQALMDNARGFAIMTRVVEENENG